MGLKDPKESLHLIMVMPKLTIFLSKLKVTLSNASISITAKHLL